MGNSTLKVALLAIFILNSITQLIMAHEVSGRIDFENRYFINQQQALSPSGYAPSMWLTLDYYHDFEKYDARLVFEGMIRRERGDNNRNIEDIQSLYWWQAFDNFEVYAGSRIVFWGVAETVHLVDVINQTDQMGNIDGEDKLGQPMLSLLSETDLGTIEIFALFGFKEMTFSQPGERFSAQLPINDADAIYQSGNQHQGIDFALRYSQVFGDWDFGLSYFDGTERTPILVYQPSRPDSLTPLYRDITQIGLDLQATKEAWLYKLEGLFGKTKHAAHYSALVAGFEYSFYGVFNSVIDVGLLSEYQFDDRPQKIANNDIAFGTRIAFNNVQSSEILLAFTVDLDDQSTLISLEADHRLNDNWDLSAQLRLFNHIAPQQPLYAIKDDDYASITLSYYF